MAKGMTIIKGKGQVSHTTQYNGTNLRLDFGSKQWTQRIFRRALEQALISIRYILVEKVARQMWLTAGVRTATSAAPFRRRVTGLITDVGI